MNKKHSKSKLKQKINKKLVPAIAVALVVMVAGYWFVLSSAAGFFASTEPEQGTASGNALVVNDSSAYGGKAVQFNAPSTPLPPQTGDCLASNKCWPNASNTGYKNAPGYPGSLATFSGSVQSNTTYSFKYFPGGLDIPPGVNNVTFIGCRFTSNSTDNANVTIIGDNITFNYSTFEPKPEKDSAPPVTFSNGYQYAINQAERNGVHGGKITVDHSDFWGWGNGIQFYWSSQSKPLIVKNSWFHDAREDGEISMGRTIDHTDAILSNDGSNQSYIVIDHNTIVSLGNTNGLALQYDGHSYDHVTVTNNYFSGFSYTVNIGGDGHLTNSIFTDNTFGTDLRPVYGPLYGWGGSNNTWRRNKWHIAPGTTWSAASNDGKFWTPNGISSTDYGG